MKKVLVFGAFDLVHPGHLYFLSEAKRKGDFLAVVLARDQTIKKLKKRKPLYPEQTRLKNLKKLKVADRILLGNLKDKYQIISKIRPEIICLGYDQEFFVRNLKSELKKRKVNCRIVRLKGYKPKQYKSSILKKIKKQGKSL